MRRHVPGLRDTAAPADIPDGMFLVCIQRARHHWEAQKPFFSISFAVLEPKHWAGQAFSGRIYATRKALWKLSWFLRDFGYDADLIRRDEIEEQTLGGLSGIVKVGHVTVNGRTYLNLEAFAPQATWKQFSSQTFLGADQGAEP